MSVRLRYLAHDLEVPEGQFAIGRSSDCQLSLDDPLVSRRHAVLVVRGGTVEVEDLSSRNGVLVNGVRVERPTRLVDGDVLTVGQQQLTIAGANAGPMPPLMPRTSPPLPRMADTIVSINNDDDDAGTTDDETRFHLVAQSGEQPDKRVHALSLIGAVADKALALGRPDEAERLLRRPLESLLERARGNPEATELRSGAVVGRAGDLAVRLARATDSPEWVHYLFELYGARAEPLSPGIVDALYDLVRKIRIDPKRLRAYCDTLRTVEEHLGPSERFLVSRIEGLERVAALK